MRFSNVRLLVKDFAGCFKFYTEQLGLEPAWGDENSGYASFKVADGIEGLALFVSDWMAPSAGNADKQQPVGMREKSMISFSVDNVDETFAALKAKGVTFMNEPTDMLIILIPYSCLCLSTHLSPDSTSEAKPFPF